MNRRLPPDAFEYYVSLGVERSYQAVADHFGVAKVTVTRRAKEEGWQDHTQELEAKARKKSDEKIVEMMDEVRERHIKGARALQAKALQVLRDATPEKAVKAASALAIGWKHELLVLGEPTERQATVEEVIRREYERWMVCGDELDKEEPDGSDEGAA